MTQVYLNGEFLPLAEARVPVLDRGFLFGDGVYEVIPAYGRKPLRLGAHLDRLERSLAGIRLDNPLARSDWEGIVARLLDAHEANDQAIYLQVTRGAPAVRDHRFPAKTSPTVFVMTKALTPRDPNIAEYGVAAVLREDTRWQRCDIKSVSLVAAVLLRQEAADESAEEALLVRDGHVVEGSISNLFVVHEGRLTTPPTGPELLSGITREFVIELARREGLPLAEQPVPVAACRTADEMWICSSTRELLPVTRLDGNPVGDGRVGPMWRRLDAAYQECKAQLAGNGHG
ncbi:MULTISPECIES: aminotransferase class IV [Thiorhodovibrio]|uniref:aminotransferase class IV n=1 Tax=Thiorhodovibrio TaxID=61593 RepID=UPI001911373E|nr:MULTISPECIES: aminotransferase class IV [Thiorhodovibrio]MBK5971124.1 D-amino acid aminotransferase [Thiorhodovibrio winogradskyi]WPL10508.1 D-alanine aminotransferase [Thiorhodovibrio litoralis]